MSLTFFILFTVAVLLGLGKFFIDMASERKEMDDYIREEYARQKNHRRPD